MSFLTAYLNKKILTFVLFFSFTSIAFYLYNVNSVQPKNEVKELKKEVKKLEINATVTVLNHKVDLENRENKTISKNRKEILKNEENKTVQFNDDYDFLNGVYFYHSK